MIISNYKNELPLIELYAEIEPFDTGYIKVDDIHNIYFEQVGNPNGKPVLFLHGGPGGGIRPKSRQFFDPEYYRIILFDQRGSGKSEPAGEIRNNTPDLLVDDIEALRKHLDIDTWHVFGGSWGSTLALLYAISHADKVLSMTLRGIFMMREQEVEWFTHGVKRFFPEVYDQLIESLNDEEKKNVVDAYFNRLHSKDEGIRMEAAQNWSNFEAQISRLYPMLLEEIAFSGDDDNTVFCVARLENHYIRNNRFKPDDIILQNIGKIRKIPAVIVQGRYDMVCPIETAYDLHKVWPEAEFIVVTDAGHASSEPGITHELVKATNKFRNI